MSEDWRNELVTKGEAVDALKGLEFCHYMEFGEYIGEDTKEVRLIRAEKAQDALVQLPSAQPQHIKGRWIQDNYYDVKFVCDRCGEPCATFTNGKPRDRFCKWCGADMRQGEHE